MKLCTTSEYMNNDISFEKNKTKISLQKQNFMQLVIFNGEI